MLRLENHYFGNNSETNGLGKCHQWLQKPWDETFKATGCSHNDKELSQRLLNWKGKRNLYKGAI